MDKIIHIIFKVKQSHFTFIPTKNIDVWRLNGIIFSFLLIILSHKCGVKIKYGFLARCHTHERKNGLKKSQKYVEIFSEQHVANKYCM